MRLEYLEPASAMEHGVVLLHSFASAEVEALRDEIATRVADARNDWPIDELAHVEAVNGCSLVVAVGPTDQGVLREGPAAFRSVLTADGWNRVVDLLEPFTHAHSGERFQYLTEDGDATWIISTDGHW
jgi:hypothetical protein